jgi:LysM repeat protein
MKKAILSIILFCLSFAGFSQRQVLIQSGDKGPYIIHTVNPKEGFYSIGRVYNIHPREISGFNGIDLNTGLTIGQSLRIPLNAINFSQTTNSGIPVYYAVGNNEGLFGVSKKNNGVLMANLRKWNNLSSDNINAGQKLIVGYILPEGAVDATANTPGDEPVQQKTNPEVVQQQVAVVQPKKTTATISEPRSAVKTGDGGYFKTSYDQQMRIGAANKDITANAGIFKTASGWQDAKYYALLDGVDPGTIVMVTNPSNNKSVYAKVLGAMSGISQNKGLNVRISNAAANVLDVTDTEMFIVRVNY